jgi:hypothetical protein
MAGISEDVISAAQARASKPAQTSRSFFGGLASRRAPATPPSGQATSAPAAPPPSAPVVPPVAPPAPEAPPSVFAAAPPVAPTEGAELNGLFAERVPASDDAAATALAGAFSEQFSGSSPTPASGQPARAASQPLSLDEVFRGQRPTTEAQRSSPSVSFDEFFSPRDSGSAPAAGQPAGARQSDSPAPPEADLALFHEWLDGLKK